MKDPHPPKTTALSSEINSLPSADTAEADLVQSLSESDETRTDTSGKASERSPNRVVRGDSIRLVSCSVFGPIRSRYTRVTLRRVVRRLAIAAILAISLGAPIAELFDTWDQTLQTGSDTEANMVVVVLCVGVAFAIGTIVVVNRIRASASSSARRIVVVLTPPREIASLLKPAPTVSPPLALRV